MASVSIPSTMPPLLYPTSVRICVDDAPGNSWQKALYSSNSFSVMSRRSFTKVFITIPKWPCGPPNAVMLCKNTAFRKGICRSRFTYLLSFVSLYFLRHVVVGKRTSGSRPAGFSGGMYLTGDDRRLVNRFGKYKGMGNGIPLWY